MKKIIITVAFSVVSLSFISCEDSINIYPVENNTTDQFYKTEFEMQQAVMGIYARLGRNGTNNDFPSEYYMLSSEGRSDNWYMASLPNAQRDQSDMRIFQVTDVTPLNQSTYARLYQLIKDANYLLKQAPESFTRFRAEASFLRAFAYFELVRAYGPQPIFDYPLQNADAKKLQRQPIQDAYAFIIKELEFASNNLQPFYTGDEAGRVGSLAAKTLLGQVYVTMAGYPLNDATAYGKAETVLGNIINEVKPRFATNYADLFDITKENKYDLFSIQFASGNQGLGSSLAAYITTSGSTGTCFPEWAYSGYTQQGQDFRVDNALVDAMKIVKDKRLDTSVAEGFWATVNHGFTPEDSVAYYTSRRILIKYLTKDNTNATIKAWNDYPLNYPVLRPADTYLLYAEALVKNNKADKAKEWVDAIRTRAGLNPLSANPTIEDIMSERRCEFLGEGKRYFDLVRMGEAAFLTTLKAFSDTYAITTDMNGSEPSKKDMLLPIPLTVMNIHTTWENNFGY